MHRIVNYKYSGNQSELLFAFKISGGSSPLKAAIIIIIELYQTNRRRDIQTSSTSFNSRAQLTVSWTIGNKFYLHSRWTSNYRVSTSRLVF